MSSPHSRWRGISAVGTWDRYVEAREREREIEIESERERKIEREGGVREG